MPISGCSAGAGPHHPFRNGPGGVQHRRNAAFRSAVNASPSEAAEEEGPSPPGGPFFIASDDEARATVPGEDG